MTLDEHREALADSKRALNAANAASASIYEAQKNRIADALNAGLPHGEVVSLVGHSVHASLHGAENVSKHARHTEAVRTLRESLRPSESFADITPDETTKRMSTREVGSKPRQRGRSGGRYNGNT